MKKTVYVVHCIDTEGPLYESLEATFGRLRDIFHLDLEPSATTLRQLQAGEIDLGGVEAAVQKVVAPHLLAYYDTWDKVDTMLHDALSESFRNKLQDSSGDGWIYNWFCVDHVDYDINPRRRDMGYHNIYDHYRSIIRETTSPQDGMHFHFHPHPPRGEAHRCATHWWAASDALPQVISRRIIDRHWFPAANRPGFHVIRPDSHWFLEQFLPFDFSSQAPAVVTATDHAQFGVDSGRFGDWRRAPGNWQPYHPAHDDYQVQGSCRRWIARCLNIGTRYGVLNAGDMRQAFAEARTGKPVVLAITNHDFRDIRKDVDEVRAMLSVVAAEFPDVSFQYAEAVQAMRSALGLSPEPPCELALSLQSSGSSTVLEVHSKTPTFGPQPWLALKTSAGTYHYDNFDIDEPFHRWRYVFDEESYPVSALTAIGVASNNAFGITTVSVIELPGVKITTKHWNLPHHGFHDAGMIPVENPKRKYLPMSV
jgi:hypothetical protein